MNEQLSRILDAPRFVPFRVRLNEAQSMRCFQRTCWSAQGGRGCFSSKTIPGAASVIHIRNIVAVVDAGEAWREDAYDLRFWRPLSTSNPPTRGAIWTRRYSSTPKLQSLRVGRIRDEAPGEGKVRPTSVYQFTQRSGGDFYDVARPQSEIVWGYDTLVPVRSKGAGRITQARDMRYSTNTFSSR